MSWLSSRQLVNKVRRNADEKTWRAFYGVYPIDNLPKFIPHLPIFIIVNTDTHNLPGTHWKCIFIGKDRRGEIFDSLAQPINDMLVRWINRFTRKWKTNHKCYQRSSSSTCGAFVLYFILSRLAAPSLETVTKVMKHSLYDNECFVRSFYHSLK